MDRRGFLGAMTGLPIAAVVQPRIGAPEIVASPLPAVGEVQQPTIVINAPTTPLTARDRDELASRIGDAVTSSLARRPFGVRL